MKVCTDACIFGAFTAHWIVRNEMRVVSILDIGAGTGLLSLMLAQNQLAEKVEAVEMEEAAYNQAKQNFEDSSWREQLNIYNSDVLKFRPVSQYDFIISNPPFYEGNLKSGNSKKNTARHSTSLSLEQLLNVITKNLSDGGSFSVILPYHRNDYFIKIAIEAGYFVTEQLLLRHTALYPFFRSILIFSGIKSIAVYSELAIKMDNGLYTPEFKDLLKPYYLHL
ncbi:MAG: methyltransferase [Ferruginibacter sp.]